MRQYLKDGVIRPGDAAPFNLLPSAGRLREKKPVAMIECIQEIPCNSCALACKLGAIRMDNVNEIPQIAFDKCTGCMACAMVCPGLAIFLLRTNEGLGYVTLPHEFIPIPRVGETVSTLDREGKVLGRSFVTWVLPPERNDGTTLVSIIVPEEWLFEARAIRVG